VEPPIPSGGIYGRDAATEKEAKKLKQSEYRRQLDEEQNNRRNSMSLGTGVSPDGSAIKMNRSAVRDTSTPPLHRQQQQQYHQQQQQQQQPQSYQQPYQQPQLYQYPNSQVTGGYTSGGNNSNTPGKSQSAAADTGVGLMVGDLHMSEKEAAAKRREKQAMYARQLHADALHSSPRNSGGGGSGGDRMSQEGASSQQSQRQHQQQRSPQQHNHQPQLSQPQSDLYYGGNNSGPPDDDPIYGNSNHNSDRGYGNRDGDRDRDRDRGVGSNYAAAAVDNRSPAVIDTASDESYGYQNAPVTSVGRLSSKEYPQQGGAVGGAAVGGRRGLGLVGLESSPSFSTDEKDAAKAQKRRQQEQYRLFLDSQVTKKIQEKKQEENKAKEEDEKVLKEIGGIGVSLVPESLKSSDMGRGASAYTGNAGAGVGVGSDAGDDGGSNNQNQQQGKESLLRQYAHQYAQQRSHSTQNAQRVGDDAQQRYFGQERGGERGGGGGRDAAGYEYGQQHATYPEQQQQRGYDERGQEGYGQNYAPTLSQGGQYQEQQYLQYQQQQQQPQQQQQQQQQHQQQYQQQQQHPQYGRPQQYQQPGSNGRGSNDNINSNVNSFNPNFNPNFNPAVTANAMIISPTKARTRLVQDVYGTSTKVIGNNADIEPGWKPSKKGAEMVDDRTRAAAAEHKR
jgi:hypothetical protein